MFQFKQIAGMIAIHALMLLGAATAWAGRGDVDPNYGEGDRLAIAPSVLLALPGDRLVIADSGFNALGFESAVETFRHDCTRTPLRLPLRRLWMLSDGGL